MRRNIFPIYFNYLQFDSLYVPRENLFRRGSYIGRTYFHMKVCTFQKTGNLSSSHYVLRSYFRTRARVSQRERRTRHRFCRPITHVHVGRCGGRHTSSFSFFVPLFAHTDIISEYAATDTSSNRLYLVQTRSFTLISNTYGVLIYPEHIFVLF